MPPLWIQEGGAKAPHFEGASRSMDGVLAVALAGVWITLAPLQQERQEIAVAAASGRVYAIGGLTSTSALASVEEFDPLTNRWHFVAPLPETLHHSAAAVVDDQIYIIGGYRTINFDATNSVYRYDPRIDRWTSVAPLL